MSKKTTCMSCGKLHLFNETCPCRKDINRNDYQKDYYKKNKEVLAPLTSSRWRKLRSIIIKRDGSRCQRCFVKYGIITIDTLQVHHIKPRIKYPELIFDESNCITLCKTCNLQLGTQEQLDFEPTTDLQNIDFDFKL